MCSFVLLRGVPSAPGVSRGPQDRPESQEWTASMATGEWTLQWTEAPVLTVITVKTAQTEQQVSQEPMDRWGPQETQDQPEPRDQRETPEPRDLQVNRESELTDSTGSRAQTASLENSAESGLLV